MREFLIIVFVLLFLMPIGSCGENPLERCFKSYNLPVDEVYLKSFSILSKYEITEIQSASGYILFNANSRNYLLTVLPSNKGTLVKIMPADTDFSKGFAIEDTVFKALDAELKPQTVKAF